MMNVTDAITQRMSVRAFKPERVALLLVQEILELAQRAPSGGNLQPWRVHVLAGEDLALFKSKIAAKWDARATDLHEYAVYPQNLWEPYASHRFQCGEDLYAAIGVAHDDQAGRLNAYARNFELFGAPVGLFISIDRRLGPPQWSDLGMYMQSVMLLAVERGLDTCSQEIWVNYGPTIAEHLALPDQQMVFAGMALGYRDPQAPINGWRTRRAPLSENVTFRGFDER